MNDIKIKTVAVSERGVLVIPEEMRNDLGINGRSTVVLIKRGNELILKREGDVARMLDVSEDQAWRKLANESLSTAWDSKDVAWDKVAPKRK